MAKPEQERSAPEQLRRGIRFAELGRLEEALKCYEEATRIEPRFVYAWYNKGFVLQELGRFEQAVECYSEAINIDPSHVSAWYSKGVALAKVGRHREAIECFDQVLRLDPNLTLGREAKKKAEEELKRIT